MLVEKHRTFSMAKNCMLGDNFDNSMISKLEESVITFVNWNTRDSTKESKAILNLKLILKKCSLYILWLSNQKLELGATVTIISLLNNNAFLYKGLNDQQ